MSIYVVADSRAKLDAISGILVQKHAVKAELLDATTSRFGPICADAIVINGNLRAVENINALRGLSSRVFHIPNRLFVLDERTRLAVAQAYALGATHVLMNPVKPAELLSQLGKQIDATMTASEHASGGEKVALKARPASFQCFRR